MSISFYDEIEIEDLEYHPEDRRFTYPCPCGSLFTISLEELQQGEEIARCPDCPLMIKIIYTSKDLERYIGKETCLDI